MILTRRHCIYSIPTTRDSVLSTTTIPGYPFLSRGEYGASYIVIPFLYDAITIPERFWREAGRHLLFRVSLVHGVGSLGEIKQLSRMDIDGMLDARGWGAAF